MGAALEPRVINDKTWIISGHNGIGWESGADWNRRPIGIALLEAIKMAKCEKSIGKRANTGDPNSLVRPEALIHPQRREPPVRERIELALVAHDLQRRHILREQLASEEWFGQKKLRRQRTKSDYSLKRNINVGCN